MLTVLVAGIGGASLGTELLKCLALADRYRIVGCDISPRAYGLFDTRFASTRIIDCDRYIEEVLRYCKDEEVDWIVPGGEQPTGLLSQAQSLFDEVGVKLLLNTPKVIEVCSDKAATFELLSELDIPMPATFELHTDKDAGLIKLPCIVKPATGTGGSASVFFATEIDEVVVYADYIRKTGGRPIAQEYIGLEEGGEFTIGVLSVPGGRIVNSVALHRMLEGKLSVASTGRGGIVSSGYTQGFIGAFPELRAQAEAIAKAIGSEGPINIQGRVRDGRLIPFEINPRLSASTYLRAFAGFNEIDAYLQIVACGHDVKPAPIREGWYLRSFTECYVPSNEVSK